MEASEMLANLMSALGGPSFSSIDFESALGSSAGNDLVAWFLNQIESGNSSIECQDGQGESKAGSARDNDRTLVAAYRNIALEEEEVAMLSKVAKRANDKPSDDFAALENYRTPSQIRQRYTAMKGEIEIREREISILTTRLELAKKASKRLSETMETLNSTIKSLDTEVSTASERIGEMSLKADAAASAARSEAIQLLEAIGSAPRPTEQVSGGESKSEQEPSLSLEEATLASLSTTRDNLISPLLQPQTPKPGTRPTRTLNSELVAADAFRLQLSLAGIDVSQAERGANLVELERLCAKIKTGGPVIGLAEEVNSLNVGLQAPDVDVKREIEKAWNLDQAAKLRSEAALWDQTLPSLATQFLAPLEHLYAQLSEEAEHVEEAEALIRALGEEFDDTNEDIKFTKDRAMMMVEPKRGPARQLEEELIKMIKDLKDLRPSYADHLVLITASDVVFEIQLLIERNKGLDAKERTWQEAMAASVSKAQSAFNPKLAAIYGHSVMNTSPPFAYPRELNAVRQEALNVSVSLENEVRRLTKEAEDLLENVENRKKLGRFVDRLS